MEAASNSSEDLLGWSVDAQTFTLSINLLVSLALSLSAPICRSDVNPFYLLYVYAYIYRIYMLYITSRSRLDMYIYMYIDLLAEAKVTVVAWLAVVVALANSRGSCNHDVW